jgi:hypothetical protein
MNLRAMYDVRWMWYRSTWIVGTLNNYVIVLPHLGKFRSIVYPLIRNSTITLQ